MNKPITIGAAAVAAIGLGVAGAAWSDNSAQDAVTYAAKHPVVVTSAPATKITIETTPAVCLQALTDADAALALSGEGFDILGDAMEGVSQGDFTAISGANERMSLFNKRLTVALAKYRSSRDDCKAAGR